MAREHSEKTPTQEIDGKVNDDARFFNSVPTLLYAVERSCTPQWHIPARSLSHFNLILLLEGELKVHIEDEERTIYQNGEYVLFIPGVNHSAETNPQNLMHCYAIEFSLGLLDDTNELSNVPLPRIGRLTSPDVVTANMQEIMRLWRVRPIGYQLRIRSLIMNVLYEMFLQFHLQEVDSHKIRLVDEVAKYIRTHYRSRLNLASLAAVVNLSPTYFGSVFRAIIGQTPIEYLNQTRVNAAKDLLISSSMSITEIAREIGIDDPPYFSRMFKQYTGLAPREFRRRH